MNTYKSASFVVVFEAIQNTRTLSNSAFDIAKRLLVF